MAGDISKVLDIPGVSYWDFRETEISNNHIITLNSEVKDITNINRKSHCVRVLYNGCIGFYHSETENYKESALKALKIAKVLSTHLKKTSIAEFKTIKANKKSVFKINPTDISIEEKKKLLLEQKPNDEKIKSYQLIYIDLNKKMFFRNSENSNIKQNLTFTYIGSGIVAKDKRFESFDMRDGAMCGYELTKSLPNIFEESIKNVKILLKANHIKGGSVPVVCDGRLTEVVIHEALGHATEADIVLQKDSCLENMKGKKIAPDYVNIYDSGLGNYWGSFFYDDEGIPSQKTMLVKNGIFQRFLHSRHTANVFIEKPTGNSRAQDNHNNVQVRMTNTCMEPGEFKEEEMFENIKKGVYLMGHKGGEVNTSNGNFMFNAQMGYLIENGELTTPLREVSLAGNTLKTLQNIVRISKKTQKGSPGFCGKNGQLVQVTGNNPHIMLKNALVGGI
ncbi:MAG: TldD/PmbA family protein [Candidatus Woesearchaeota archaeon]